MTKIKIYNFFSLAIIYVIPHEIFQNFYTSNSSAIVESEIFFLRNLVRSAESIVHGEHDKFAESIRTYSENTQKVFKGTVRPDWI